MNETLKANKDPERYFIYRQIQLEKVILNCPQAEVPNRKRHNAVDLPP